MNVPARIAILIHQRQVFSDVPIYMVGRLAELWKEWGNEVVVVRGTQELVPADVVIVHIDLSVVPQHYIEFAGRYPKAINTRCVDIRKSRFSRVLVDEHSGWTGQVMVKSDLNCGGQAEKVFGAEWPGADEGPVYGKPLGRTLYPNLAAVPAKLRGLRDVVIERFVPERLPGGRYGVRFHIKLGERVLSLRQSSDHYIVRTEHDSRIEVAEPDPFAHEWCEEHGIDFGKLDYVVHDGEPILLDVNKTQGGGLLNSYPKVLTPHLPELARGIESFL